jgi:lipopolysaccharide heptosyltransferase I
VPQSLPPQRILIVRLSSLGDVIQTLPLPTAIRRAFPQAWIGWAIDSELAPAIDGHRDVDQIHPFPRTRWRQAGLAPWRWPRIAREMSSFTAAIDAARYDLAIDAQGLLMSALIPFLARIRRRVGFGHRRELSHLFYTERYVSKADYFAPNRPHSEHILALARAIGCDPIGWTMHLPEVALRHHESIAAALSAAFAAPGSLLALAPGTQWPSKRWPVEYWLELMRRILSETTANVVLIGAGADAACAAELAAQLGERGRARVLNLAGKTTLPELYALLGMTRVTIAADTAPLHAAGAARCPHLIGLYGPTPTGRTGPAGSPHISLLRAVPLLHCQPCRRSQCRYGTNQCMWEVAPSQVFAAVAAALKSGVAD